MHLPSFIQAFLGALLFVTTAWGQLGPFNPTGINLVGRISGMTLDDGNQTLRGGTITVNGVTVTVPKNLLVTLPSISVAWAEMFDETGNPLLPQFGQTSWNVNLFGNIANDQYIAGLVYIAQDAFQLLQGVISSIDFETGIFTVGGTAAAPANAGWKCRLNDPTGVFGLPYTDNPLWTVDPISPSIKSTNGFPLCIPRNETDPLCLLTNRPKDPAGNFLTTFQFGNPDTLPVGAPDPRRMVPLTVGDFITFSGTDVGDGLIAVYSLVANLGITTAPGTKPVYVTFEEGQYAIVDTQGGEIGETRAVAYTTDPTIPVSWFAQDVDPCTGKITERQLLITAPSLDDPPGKCTFRLRKVDVSPPVRNMGFRSVTGTSQGPQGLIAGEFFQPVFEYIFPELLVFGAPPLINSFETIPYLTQGSGPYVPGNFLATPLNDTVIVGQLDPWPEVLIPVAANCTPTSTDPGGPSSTSSSGAPSQTPPFEIVTIVSVTAGSNSGGITPVSVVASCNNPSAKLTVQIIGDSTASAPMNNLGNGLYSVTISIKHPTTVSVISDGGGAASAAVTR